MRAVATLLLLLAASAVAADSTCFGTTSNGRLEAGCKLPASGANFTTYSRVLGIAGRTYVHCDVHGVLLDAYRALEASHPDLVFVYGETGKRRGGPFPPHKTHQNGLSVDFMTPVVDGDGRSVPLPTSVFNRYGYDIDFTVDGRGEGMRVDFEAIAAHLAAIVSASEAAGGRDLARDLRSGDAAGVAGDGGVAGDRGARVQRAAELGAARRPLSRGLRGALRADLSPGRVGLPGAGRVCRPVPVGRASEPRLAHPAP